MKRNLIITGPILVFCALADFGLSEMHERQHAAMLADIRATCGDAGMSHGEWGPFGYEFDCHQPDGS